MNKTLLLLGSLFFLGCAAPDAEDDAVATESAIEASPGNPAVVVDARWSRVVTGTPTYGDDATTPSIRIGIRVDDAAVRREHAGFDGYEKPFALVPRKSGWQRVPLQFGGTSMVGYISLRPVDVYEADALLITEEDLALVRAQGVAIGMDTNVGVVWGQREGANFTVVASPY